MEAVFHLKYKIVQNDIGHAGFLVKNILKRGITKKSKVFSGERPVLIIF